jgi:hypothetical protein
MKTMQKLAVIVLGVVMSSAAFAGVASAQQGPNVAKLTAFSAPPSYMSLAGYFRFKNHQLTNQWLTYKESAKIVAAQ